MTTRYFLTAKELRIVKQACEHMGLQWQPEAARPRTARKLVAFVIELGLEAGCDAWAQFLADEEYYRMRPESHPSPITNRRACNAWYEED